jgi:(4S)-4-hydroxy-5-phosphonooxypentane-2,3-dione isomerase
LYGDKFLQFAGFYFEEIHTRRKNMLVVQVHIHVKEDYLEAFKAASIENAKNSMQESGIARFDLLQQLDDPTRFMLVEVYRNEDAPAMHKETNHYAKWRDTVVDMLAEPRYNIKYDSIYPGEEGW